MANILVAAPIYFGSMRDIDTFLDAWRSLTYPNLQFALIENNEPLPELTTNLKNLQYIRELGDLVVEHIPPFSNENKDSEWVSLTRAQNRILSLFLDQPFDYLMFNETSRPVPSNIIEHLLAHDLPVIGALYKDSWHPGYYCVYDFDVGRKEHLMEAYLRIDEINEPQRVHGLGFGATLIKREVLEQISQFRCELHAADTYFFEDMAEKNIDVYVAPIQVPNTRVENDPEALSDWLATRTKLLSKD